MQISAAFRTTPWRVAMLCAICWLPSGCAPHAPPGFPIEELGRKSRYCSEYEDYLGMAPHKALAVAGDHDGLFVSAVSDGDQNGETPEARACRFCEGRRVDRRVEAPCTIQARDDSATQATKIECCEALGPNCAQQTEMAEIPCPSRATAARLKASPGPP